MPLSSHSHATTSSPLFGVRGGSLFARLKRLFLMKIPQAPMLEENPIRLKPFRLAVAQWSDIGHKRAHNEDSAAYVIPKNAQELSHKGALLVVADGMGGHTSGEVASQMAVEAVCKTYYQDEDEKVEASLLYAVKYANSLIYQHSMEHRRYEGMGTTCVAAVLHDKKVFVANVGDSRAYVIHAGRVKQVSQDHSWVAEQVRAGILTEEQAEQHMMRHMVTRSLGADMDVQVDMFNESLEEGDTILLCSDGLSGAVSESEMLEIIEHYSAHECAYQLVERANTQGGTDNITAIVARISFHQ